ncbi:MAG: HlyD family efflux transporter periplasmic adaptor subunit [Bacteroidetes bacterium]|nr:HlyD family efflux transporter periplasmic adaptor subunit [Bacteroidota bacterium]
MMAALLVGTLPLAGCGAGSDGNASDQAEGRTPVTVTHVVNGPIRNTVVLNATSRFLRKNTVRSTVTGRVERNFIALGDRVTAGHPLYVVRTKEAEALGTMAARDSSFRIGGSITINAPASGIVTQMDKQQNDYVSDGDQLAVIADASSSAFVMQVPYELDNNARIGDACTIVLPDSSTVQGTITTRLSMMDGASQTQGFVVKPAGSRVFPEGLAGTVRLTVDRHADAQVLPASSVLGNEEMTRFWVMRLIDDSTAVNVPVQRGIVTHDSVEVLKPRFDPGDRFLLTGGYGLADTARVVITH